jgi:hypothetical protein
MRFKEGKKKHSLSYQNTCDLTIPQNYFLKERFDSVLGKVWICNVIATLQWKSGLKPVSRLRNTLINLGATFCQNLVLMLPIDPVIPAKVGIRSFQWVLDSGFRWSDIVLRQ